VVLSLVVSALYYSIINGNQFVKRHNPPVLEVLVAKRLSVYIPSFQNVECTTIDSLTLVSEMGKAIVTFTPGHSTLPHV
jgi:hypothetical protein